MNLSASGYDVYSFDVPFTKRRYEMYEGGTRNDLVVEKGKFVYDCLSNFFQQRSVLILDIS
jgi:hypothetical protein